MVKAYLRYDLANTFGVVASNSNVVYDHTGKLAITACLENICLWNVKQGTLVCFHTNCSYLGCKLIYRQTHCSTVAAILLQVKTLVTPATSGKAPAEVTQIAVGRSDSHQIAVGHADGTVSARCSACGSQTHALTSAAPRHSTTQCNLACTTGMVCLQLRCLHLFSAAYCIISALQTPAAASVLVSPQVRLWNLQSGTCDVTLSGHKGAVTALKYNLQGGMLASGAQDTDIIVWDVAAEAGLYRLRGHQDQVTDLVSHAIPNPCMHVDPTPWGSH